MYVCDLIGLSFVVVVVVIVSCVYVCAVLSLGLFFLVAGLISLL